MEDNKLQKTTPYKRLVWFILIVVTLWLATWFFTDYFISDENKRGVFGDKFGSINSLFSGLAFATLIFTIFMQKEEITLQRHDIKLQIDELTRSTDEMVQQNKLLNHQKFENKFFQLVSLLQQLINSLQFESNQIQGRLVFKKLYYSKLTQIYKERRNITTAFISTYEQNQEILSHYLNFMEHLLYYIDSTIEIEDSERMIYTDIVKSQLSAHEIIFLFYYSVSEIENSNFKQLMIKYKILEKVDTNLLLDSTHTALFLELRKDMISQDHCGSGNIA